MTDQIGRGVVSFEADASGLKAEMNSAAQAVQDLGSQAAQTGADAARSLDGITSSATEMGEGMSAAATRFIASLTRQTVTMEGGTIAWAEYRAEQLGAVSEAQQYIDRMRDVQAQTQAAAVAQQALSAAMSQAASDNAFLDSLRAQADTYGLSKTQILQYQAAQKGLESEAAGLISRLSQQEAATKAAADEQQRFNAVMAQAASDNAFINSVNARANAIGKSTTQLLAEEAAQRGLTAETSAAIAKLQAHEHEMGEAGEASEGFGLKTAGARKEVAVLIHELLTGNIKNFGGSLLVLGERMDILGAVFSGTGLAIAAVAATAIAFGTAIVQGQNQLDAYNKAVQSTGGFAGVTADQLVSMATQMSGLGLSVTKSNDLLINVAATGKISGEAIQSVATASALLAEATGTDSKQIVSQFAEMANNVADGAAKMSEQYHFLTVAQYDEIKALQEHGDAAGAMKLAADALTGSLEAQKVPLGTLPTLLHTAADAWSKFWQAAMNLGKPDTPTSRLNDLRATLAEQEGILARSNSGSGGPLDMGTDTVRKTIANLKSEIAGAQHEADLHTDSAGIVGWLAEQKQGAVDAAQAIDKLSQSLDKNYAKQKSLNDLQQQFEKLYNDPSDPTHANPRLAGVTRNADGTFSGGEYANIVKGINEKDKPRAASTAIDTAQLAQQVDAVKQALNQINTAYSNSETLLDAAHKAGSISDANYYQQQRDLIAKTVADQATQLQKQEDILKQHKASGAEQIRINKQIQDTESQLAKVRADASTKTQQSIQQEDAAMVQRMEAVVKFNAALKDQLETQQNAADIQVASVGMGAQEAQQLQQLNSIQRQYDRQRTTLVGQLSAATTPDQKAVYAQQLTALQGASDQAVKIAQDGFDRMRIAQGDWKNGAVQAYQNLADQSSNVAGQVSSAFTDAFNGMADAFATFVTTGKLSFTSLATSVISDIARMAAKAAESQLFGAALNAIGIDTASSTVGSSFAGVFHLAGGGAVNGPGSSTSDSIPAMLSDGEYVVNARGVSQNRPILDAINGGAKVDSWQRFATGGYVGTAAVAPRANGGDGVTIAPQITIEGGSNAAVNQSNGDDLNKKITAAVRAVVVNERKQGGALWKLKNNIA